MFVNTQHQKVRRGDIIETDATKDSLSNPLGAGKMEETLFTMAIMNTLASIHGDQA